MGKLSKQTRSSTGLNQALAYFEGTLAKPHNYVRIARQYLLFIISKQYSIDEISAKLFAKSKAPVYLSACRKFIAFAQDAGIANVYDDVRANYEGNAAVLDFLANAQIRPNSKKTYSIALNEMELFLSKIQQPISRPTVLAFLTELRDGRSLSVYTINNYLSAVRQFSEYCILKREELQLSQELVVQLRDISSIRSLKTGGSFQTYSKESLSEKEIEQLMTVITNPRDKAVIALMAYQGLRTVELTRLEWVDIRSKGGKKYLAVLSKGRNEKELIPLMTACEKILTLYKSKAALHPTKMFEFNNTSIVRKITNQWLRVAGLKGEKVSAHSLRHSVAQIMIDKGVPKPMVQRFLRHKNEATTSIYTAKQEQKDFLTFDFE